MIKVLFIMEKHDRCNPNWGPTTFTVLPETLNESGLAQVLTFYVDELSQTLGATMMDEVLLEVCAAEKPHLIIFIPTGWIQVDPSRNTMNTIINTLGIKVFMVRGDAEGAAGRRFNESWFPFVSFMGFVDVTVSSLGYSNNPKAVQHFPCLDAKHFYNRKLERDIDVSFVGSIGNWLARRDHIDLLRENGINVVVKGGLEFETRIGIEEYSEIISRSKISLNFCLHRTEGYPQIKRRVFDILSSKTCMLEDFGTETAKFFIPDLDFVMYQSKEDLLEKALYYLSHDKEREKIARSGYKKVTEVYNAKNLWAYVFEKAGLGLPKGFARDSKYEKLRNTMRWIVEGRL